MKIIEIQFEEKLKELGQACIDWYIDTGECHLCQVDENGNHNNKYGICPVQKAIELKEQLQKRI